MTLPILQEYWRLHPVDASRVGVRDFDDALSDLSADGLEARRAWRSTAANGDASLADLDVRVLHAELSSQDVEDDWQLPSRAPALYVEEAMQGLHVLLARRTQPDSAAAARSGSAAARARSCQYPTGAGPPEWLEIALVACAGALRFPE